MIYQKFLLSIVIFLLVAVNAYALNNPDKAEFIFMDELEPGMIGEAKTVVEGARVDSFMVELLAIARDAGFDNRDYLLCRMSGDLIDKSGGIAGGMSGSPVYFSGRLAGAVSGHWSYTDQRIGIVTPIEYMLEEIDFVKSDIIADGESKETSFWINRDKDTKTANVLEIEILPSVDSIPSGLRPAFVPSSTPLSISGVDENDLELIKPLLKKFSTDEVLLVPIDYPPNIKVPLEFVPGCTVSVPLARGDISYGGFGTVTWVSDDGKYFLGFGHSMGRRGPCRIPAGTGYIYGTLASRFRSTKMGVALDPIATICQDRGGAIAGVIGEFPDYIPVKVGTQGSSLKDRIILRSEITPSHDEYPSVATSVVIASISRSLDGDTSGTLETNTTVKINVEGKTSWFRRYDIYTGTDILQRYRDDLNNLMMKIRQTELKKVSIDYIDVSVEYRPERMEARIEGLELLSKEEINKRSKDSSAFNENTKDVFSDKDKYDNPEIDSKDPDTYILKPGSLYLACVNLVNYRAPREQFYIPFYMPADFNKGKGKLVIRSASGDMPSSYSVGQEVQSYVKKWVKDDELPLLDDGEGSDIIAYLESIFDSNRGNVLVFEIASDKNGSKNNGGKKLFKIEFERSGAVKGIWQRDIKVE